MEVFFLVFITMYVFFLLRMKKAWEKPPLYPTGLEREIQAALLVPFRNESQNLPALLLNLQKVIPSRIEVLFIDDKSEDGSKSTIDSFLKVNNLPNWKMIESSGIGKKAALTTAIGLTQAEIIMTTDVDCQIPENWVVFMLDPFRFAHVHLVAGPVLTRSGKRFFEKFQQIEWASILLLTHFFFALKKPLICSGANLAYRRASFYLAGGYNGNEKYFSGDDEFLLKKMNQNFGPGSALYIKGEEVLVKTNPLSGLAAFVQQRVRWASKWKQHGSPIHALSAFLSYAVALIQMWSIILIFGGVGSKIAFVVFWALKISTEKMVLGRILSGYKIDLYGINYIKTSLVHPIYVFLVGTLAFIGKFSWKGRKNDF